MVAVLTDGTEHAVQAGDRVVKRREEKARSLPDTNLAHLAITAMREFCGIHGFALEEIAGLDAAFPGGATPRRFSQPLLDLGPVGHIAELERGHVATREPHLLPASTAQGILEVGHLCDEQKLTEVLEPSPSDFDWLLG